MEQWDEFVELLKKNNWNAHINSDGQVILLVEMGVFENLEDAIEWIIEEELD